MAGKNLDELENVAWGDPLYSSYLVTTCHRLRKKPLDDFTAEDFLIMIGQKIGIPHLMPRAIAVLEREPLAAGDYYPGDLLAAVLECREWLQSQPSWMARIVTITERAMNLFSDAEPALTKRFNAFLQGMR